MKAYYIENCIQLHTVLSFLFVHNRPNRAGETPYSVDSNSQKPILGSVFGARRLNTHEDSENILGYDLYSSALADMLTEPTLSMPITVSEYLCHSFILFPGCVIPILGENYLFRLFHSDDLLLTFKKHQ